MPVNFNHITDTITAVGGAGLLNNIGPGGASYQLFTSSSTWTKPAAAIGVYVECVGGGGGGGEGALVDPTTDPTKGAGGGGGGNGGVWISRFFTASSLTSTVTVTIGAGGPGGQHMGFVPSTSSGVGGYSGGASSFGSYITTPQALGGLGGPVDAAPSQNLGAYYGNRNPFVNGLYAGAGGYGNSPNSFSSNRSGQIGSFGPGGGGQGGSIPSTGFDLTKSIGGDGGFGYGEFRPDYIAIIFGSAASVSVGGGGLGGGGSTSSNAFGDPGSSDCGGGGGNAGSSGGGTGGAGGAGGAYGGGGGGSGGMLGVASNNPGGAGGAGYVRVVTW